MLILLLLLFALAWLPLGVALQFDGAPLVRIILGPLRLQLLPGKKKSKKTKKEKKPKKKTQKKKKSQDQPESKQGAGGKKPLDTVQAAIPLVQLAVSALNRFRKLLLFRRLTIHITTGAANAADAALAYGRAWAAVGVLSPMIEGVFHIQKRDYAVEVDYEAQGMGVFLQADLTVFLWELLSFAIYYGVRGLLGFLKFQKRRKGGAST